MRFDHFKIYKNPDQNISKILRIPNLCFFSRALVVVELFRGAQKLTGENLKLVWAEFSTIS